MARLWTAGCGEYPGAPKWVSPEGGKGSRERLAGAPSWALTIEEVDPSPRGLLAAGRGQEVGVSLGASKRNAACGHHYISPVRPQVSPELGRTVLLEATVCRHVHQLMPLPA